jgi:hypothetical protein
MNLPTFNRLGGLLAMAAGVVGFIYAVAFILIEKGNGGVLSGLTLMLGGLLSSGALTALYRRVEATDAGFSLWAFLMGVVSALATAAHGAYDLANAINPPESNVFSLNNLPSQLDPRGFFAFGVSGLAVLIFAWLIRRSGQFPKNFAYLGFALGALTILLFLARMVILSATSPVIVVLALLTGFILNPGWYLWLGMLLSREAGTEKAVE